MALSICFVSAASFVCWLVCFFFVVYSSFVESYSSCHTQIFEGGGWWIDVCPRRKDCLSGQSNGT